MGDSVMCRKSEGFLSYLESVWSCGMGDCWGIGEMVLEVEAVFKLGVAGGR